MIALWRRLMSRQEPGVCDRCHRRAGFMTQMIATEYRLYCHECYQHHILGKRSVMEPAPDFQWPLFSKGR